MKTFIKFEVTNEHGEVMHVSCVDEERALLILNLKREGDTDVDYPKRKIVKSISVIGKEEIETRGTIVEPEGRR